MKLLIAALFVTATLTAQASVTGTFKAEKEIFVVSESKESCLEMNGQWQSEEEACIIKTADEASVEKVDGGYKLHISTIGSNYHSCEFEGKAHKLFNVLTSKVKAEAYDSATDKIVEVTCVVKAKIKNNVMSISTNQNCQSFCGANSWLDVSDLKKVK